MCVLLIGTEGGGCCGKAGKSRPWIERNEGSGSPPPEVKINHLHKGIKKEVPKKLNFWDTFLFAS